MAFFEGAGTGAAAGSAFGPIGAGIGAAIGGLGQSLGLFGSSYKPPPGTIPQDRVLKLLKSGKSIDEIIAMGPMSSRFPSRAFKQLQKAGVSEADIQRLYAGPGGIGGRADPGPMGMDAFSALLPAVMANPSVFSNPNAAGWLSSVFGPGLPGGPPAPQPAPPASPGLPMPFEGNLPAGFAPWRNMGAPKDPFTKLRGLAGPFGNGGGPIAPGFGGGALRRASNRSRY